MHHVTLNTAHARVSPRHEVSDEALRVLLPALKRALAGEQPGIHAPTPDCTITAAAAGDEMALTVYCGPAPLVTVGITPHTSPDFWQALHRMATAACMPVATDPELPPPAPWCAAILLQGIVTAPDAVHWLGDFERIAAWAWLERLQPAQEG